MAIWYAKPAATGAADGTSWTDAATLDSCIGFSAASGDDIYAIAGTYPTIDMDTAVSIYLNFNAASPQASPGLRDLEADISIIEGDFTSGAEDYPVRTYVGGGVVDGGLLKSINHLGSGSVHRTIYVKHALTIRNAVITNDPIVNPNGAGAAGMIYVGGGGDLTLDNSVLIGGYAANAAIYASSATSVVLVRNSVLEKPVPSIGTPVIVNVGNVAASITVENSIQWPRPDGTNDYGAGGITYSITEDAGTGNDDSDPLFVDAANSDWTLQAGSPAIGTADSGSALADDMWLRTRDGSPDMGPLEYQSAGGIEFTSSCLSSSSSSAALSVGREFTSSTLSASAVDAEMIVGREFTASVESTTSVTASITVSSAIEFTASCVSSSAGTCLLTVGREFTASVESDSSSTVSLSVGRAFTASCESSSASGASLTVARAFTASCESDTSCDAAVTVGREFTASAESSSEVAATISVTSAIQFTASCLSGSQCTGTLSVGREFTASAESESSAAGQLTVGREFTASVESGSESTAQLTIGDAVQFVASCLSGSSSSATLTVGREFTAAVESESSAEAALAVGRSFVANSESGSSAQAQVTVGRSFTASALSESECSATIRTTAGIQFTASCASSTSCSGLLTKAQAAKAGDVEAATTRRAGPATFTRHDRPATIIRG